jgi:hypothetical protein
MVPVLLAWVALQGTSQILPRACAQAAGWNDLSDLWVFHGKVHRQNAGDAVPGPDPDAPFALEVSARAAFTGFITSVAVETPSGLRIQPALQEDGVTYRSLTVKPSEEALLAAAPVGAYRIAVVSLVSGSQNAVLNLPVGTWPPTPVVTSLGQAINFAQDLPLTWSSFSGAGGEDRIEATIRDATGLVVWRFPDTAGAAPVANAGVTRAVVPADTLNSGEAYEGRLRFIKIPGNDTASLPGATLGTARYTETRFVIADGTPITPAVRIVTTVLPAGRVGEGYWEQITVAGRRPFTWSVEEGRLPRGLQLDPGRGTIEGMPTVSGSYPVVVQVRDAGGQSARQPLSIDVTGVAPPLEITVTNLPPAEPFVAYFAELELSGGVPPYLWSISSGRLPGGLELRECCGMIVGAVKEAGRFPLVLQLEDGAGQIARKELSIEVASEAVEPLLRITRFVREEGGRIKANITGETNDPVTVEMSIDLRKWEPILTALRPENGDLEWNDQDPGRKFYRVRLGHPLPAINPLSVGPVVSTNEVVTGLLTAKGITLALTNATGNIYRLEMPTNAVSAPVNITMALVKGIKGLPVEGGGLDGVELAPSGLWFFNPGTLSIQFAGPVPEGATTWAYEGGGGSFHLYPSFARENRLVVPVFHFSGYGQFKLTSQELADLAKHNPCSNPFRSELASLLLRYKPDFPPASAFSDIFVRWQNVIVTPLLKGAMTDEKLLRPAVKAYLEYDRTRQLSGFCSGCGPFEGRYGEKAREMILKGYRNAMNKAHARCVLEHKIEEGTEMVRLDRDLETLGLGGNLEAVVERISRCQRFELQLESMIEVDAAHEHVRSGRAVYQLDATTLAFTGGIRTNLLLVSWEIDAANGQRLRPITSRQKLVPEYLEFLYPDPPDPASKPPDDECKPKEEPLPKPTDLHAGFSLSGDPVSGVEVMDNQGRWHVPPAPMPAGSFQFWEPYFRMAHPKEYGQWPIPKAGDYIGYRIGPGWHIFGGQLYARITFSGPITAAGGNATEDTVLELFHAPLPLRKRDTRQ